MTPTSPANSPEERGAPVLIAVSEPLKKLLTMAERIAGSTAAVLIVGETGSGKELIAFHVHRHSLRGNKPLIEINCAAIPENLVESELFGYEKGAFSGADSPKPGMFELGDTGTVFLDEIGELDMKTQAKLLRILDGAPYYRLGGNKKIQTSARIIAATNRDLEQAVAKGTFRADLFHRIAQFQLRVPPLRERPDDILPLAKYFLSQSGVEDAKFSAEALDMLKAYEWPGNARELRNTVLQASIMAGGGEILPEYLSIRRGKSQINAVTPAAEEDTIDNAERTAIRRALESCANNHTTAAAMLGISRRTLLRKLKAYRQEGSTMASFLGTMSAQQQKSYRSAVDMPIEITTEKQAAFPTARIVNISLGGVGVMGIKNAFELTGTLTLKFEIDGVPIVTTGRMQWAEPEGCVGIRFASMDSESQRTLQAWLRRRQTEEGWALLHPLEKTPKTITAG